MRGGGGGCREDCPHCFKATMITTPSCCSWRIYSRIITGDTTWHCCKPHTLGAQLFQLSPFFPHRFRWIWIVFMQHDDKSQNINGSGTKPDLANLQGFPHGNKQEKFQLTCRKRNNKESVEAVFFFICWWRQKQSIPDCWITDNTVLTYF